MIVRTGKWSTRCIIAIFAVLAMTLAINRLLAAELSPAMTKDIRSLILLTTSPKSRAQISDALIAGLKKTMPSVPAQRWKAIRTNIGERKLIELTIPVYGEHFSHDDVKTLLAFYRSPPGRKLIEVQPKLSAALSGVYGKWMATERLRIMSELRKDGFKTR